MPAKITINPDLMGDNRDALAVAYNEAYRVLMEQNDFEPQAEPTEEQVQFFADTAYANDPLQMKRTITARIATYDTSVPNPTPEQYQDVVDMLNMVINSGAITNDEEESVVTSTLEDMEAKVSGGQGEQGTPPEGMPLEQLAPQEAVPPEGMEGMPAEGMSAEGTEGMPPEMMGQESGGLEQLNPAMLQQLMGAGTQAAVKAGEVDEELDQDVSDINQRVDSGAKMPGDAQAVQPVAQTAGQPATEQPTFPKQPTQADTDAYNQMETRIQELIKAGNSEDSGLIQGLRAAQEAAWGRATGQEKSETQRQIDNGVINGTHTDLTMPSGERWRIYGTNGIGGVDPEAMKYMSQVSRDANYSTTGRFRREQMTKYLDQKKFTDIKISGEGVDRNAGLAERATAIAKDLQAKGDKAVASARKAYAELSALDPNTLPRRERLMLQTLGRALGKIPAEQAAQATPATTGATTPPATTGATTPPATTGATTPPATTGATTPPATTETLAATETKKTEKAEENPLTLEETTEESAEGSTDTTAKPNPEAAAPEKEVLAEPTLTRTDEANRDLADGASAAVSTTGGWAKTARDLALTAKTEAQKLVNAGKSSVAMVDKINDFVKGLTETDIRSGFAREFAKSMAGAKNLPEKIKPLFAALAEGKPVDVERFKKILQDSPELAKEFNKALGVSSVGGKIKNSWVGKLADKAGSKVGAFMMKHPKIAKSLGVAGTIGGAVSAGAEFFKANELDDLVKAMEADLADIENTGPLYTEDYDETVEELRDAINIAKQRRDLSVISGTVGAASTVADFIPGAAPVALAADVAMMAGEAGGNYLINKTEQLLAESRAENQAARDSWKSAEGVYDRFIGQSITSDLGSVDGKTRGTYSDQSLNTLLEEQGGLYKETFDQLMGNPNSQMAKTMKTQSWMRDNVSFSMLPVQVRVEFFDKLKELGMAKAGGISKDFQQKRLLDREKARKSLENPTNGSGVGSK